MCIFRLLSVAGLLLSFLLSIPNAFGVAENRKRVYFSGGTAVSYPTYPGSSSRGAFLFNGGYKLTPKFSLGLYYYTSDKEERLKGLNSGQFLYIFNGIEADYYFISEKRRVVYAGGRVGTGRLKMDPDDEVRQRFSVYNIGLHAGYDWIPTREFGFGASFAAIQVLSATNSKNSILQKSEAFNVFSIIIYGKLWLFEWEYE